MLELGVCCIVEVVLPLLCVGMCCSSYHWEALTADPTVRPLVLGLHLLGAAVLADPDAKAE